MTKVAVMTDTVSHMPQELADKYDIKILPMSVTIEGKSYPETEVNLAEYYQHFPQWREAGKLPTTSGVSLGAFLQAYHELSQKAEAIVCITHSAKLGMTLSTAQQAKAMAQEGLPHTTIEVIDSCTACGAQMLITLEAARAAAAGKSFPQVVEVANHMVGKVSHISLYDDLYYLTKGGRIHKARPWASSKISNTAILEMDAFTGGEHKPLARCKTKGETLRTLFDIVRQRSQGKKLHVVIDHADAPAEAEQLRDKTLSQFSCAELYVNQVLPVVTLHAGVGVRILSWWRED